MPVYLCRWPNGDTSLVSAPTKPDALVLLDEVGDAEEAMLTVVPDAMVHLRLGKRGGLSIDGFGHTTRSALMDAYPVLEELYDQLFAEDDLFDIESPNADQRTRIAAAVEAERKRLPAQPEPHPRLRVVAARPRR